MAIKGLQRVESLPVAPVESLGFRSGKVDVAEALEVSLDALTWLKVIKHPDEVEKSLHADFKNLAKLGVAGCLYPRIPRSLASLTARVHAVDKTLSSGVLPSDIYEPFWSEDMMTKSQGTNYPTVSEGRLAVFSLENNGCDPMLHGTGLAVDYNYGYGTDNTQFALIKELSEAFNGRHPERSIVPTTTADLLMLILMENIRGRQLKSAGPDAGPGVLNTGGMVAVTEGRRFVGPNEKLYGKVYRNKKGRLILGVDDGAGHPSVGFGLTIGPSKY